MNEEKSPAKIAPRDHFRGDCGVVLRGYRKTRRLWGVKVSDSSSRREQAFRRPPATGRLMRMPKALAFSFRQHGGRDFSRVGRLLLRTDGCRLLCGDVGSDRIDADKRLPGDLGTRRGDAEVLLDAHRQLQ